MFAAGCCWLGVWLRCSGRVWMCSFLCSFFLPFWHLLGFFSLTSIAYRRVIRVYQYEVGDDLSGRFFFPLIFLPHFGFQMHPLIPRLAFLPTNSRLRDAWRFVSLLTPGWFLVPCSGSWACASSLQTRVDSELNPVLRITQVFGAFSLLQSDSALEIPFLRSSKARRIDFSGDENLSLVT